MEQRNLFNEVNKKLIPLAKKQDIEAKYLKLKEEKNNKLLLLETKINKNILKEKQNEFNLKEKTIEQTRNLLNYLSKLKPLTLSNINSNFNEKQNEIIQTEEDESEIILKKLNLLGEENEKNKNKKLKYKKEKEILKKENNELKNENDKLSKEVNLLQSTIDELTKYKEGSEKMIQQLKLENSNLNNKILENEKTLNEYKNYKNLFEEKTKLEVNKNDINTKLKNKVLSTMEKVNVFDLLIINSLFKNIIDYLNIEDICNMKLVNKSIFITIISNNTILKEFYNKIIVNKNEKIKNLQKYDIKKEYLINNTKLEQLIKEYALTNKIPGKDLKISIGKCLNFLNKEVRISLGFPTAKCNNISITNNNNLNDNNNNNNSNAYNSFLSGFKNMFGYNLLNTNANISQSKTEINTPQINKSNNSSRTMSFISINNVNDIKNQVEEYDQILTKKLDNCLNGNDYSESSIYEFDFQSADEIKMYLNRFIKTGFPVEKLTGFIKELCNGYSELLISSNRTLLELKEMDIVKCALNERLKNFIQLNTNNEKKIKILTSYESMNNKKINDELNNNLYLNNKIIQSNKETIEKLTSQVDNYKMNLSSYEKKNELYKEKYQQIQMDYYQFRNIFQKENQMLKFQLQNSLNEKNLLAKKIEDFNKFYDQIKLN